MLKNCITEHSLLYYHCQTHTVYYMDVIRMPQIKEYSVLIDDHCSVPSVFS